MGSSKGRMFVFILLGSAITVMALMLVSMLNGS
jgi:hypothetical protein